MKVLSSSKNSEELCKELR